MRIALAQGSPSCEPSLVESKAPKCPGVMWLQLCLTFAPESDLITPVLRDQQWLLLHILILRNQVLTVPGRPPPPHIRHQVFLLLYPGAVPTLEQGGAPASSLQNPPGQVSSSPFLLRRPLSVEPDLVLCLPGPPSPLPPLLQCLSPSPSLPFKSFS